MDSFVKWLLAPRPQETKEQEITPVENTLYASNPTNNDTATCVLSSITDTEFCREVSSFPFDKSILIRNACIAAVASSYLIGITAVAVSMSLHGSQTAFKVQDTRAWAITISFSNSISREVVNLALSALATLCTEAMGYVHSNSLKWALWESRRLQYNSNLRLFAVAGSRGSRSNSWYANMVSSFGLVSTYAGASLAFIDVPVATKSPAILVGNGQYAAVCNGPAFLFFGVGLILQAIIATWCLLENRSSILTWSSNVLTVVMACLNDDKGHLRHRGQRCMLSTKLAAEEGNAPTPTQPSLIQPSLRATDSSTIHIVRFVWSLLVLSITWMSIAYLITERPDLFGHIKSISLPDNFNVGILSGFLLVASFQALVTLGLHSVELVVNRNRDENCWREAEIPKSRSNWFFGRKCTVQRHGAKKAHNSITAVLTSWQSLTLYVLKPVAHWVFGNSIVFDVNGATTAISFNSHYISGLCACSVIVLVFVLRLSYHSPTGSLPSAWGNLQTLADLIDDWDDGDSATGSLFWGDKGMHDDGPRHAGTTCDASRLDELLLDALYE